MSKTRSFSRYMIHAAVVCNSVLLLAEDDKATGIAAIADTVKANLSALADLVGQVAFLAGLLFFVSAVFKFKQHKDNPTQVPIGTPLSMLAVSAALMFMGNFITPLGQTLFGASAEAGGKATGLTEGFQAGE